MLHFNIGGIEMLANANLDYQQKIDPKEIDALVFSGAGAVGIAYGGVAEALDQLGILSNVKTVAGSSAGSIIALILALGYNVSEIKDVMEKTNFADFMDGCGSYLLEVMRDPKKLEDPIIFISLARNMIGKFGACPGDFAKKFLSDLITAPIQKRGNSLDAQITFKELYNATQCKLIVTVCNIGSEKEFYVSYENHPDLKVIDVVYSSMSIPLVFQPLDVFQQGSKCCVDGGTVSNTPVEAVEGKNWLGFVCETKQSYITPTYSPINNILEYIPGLIKTLRNTKVCEIIGNQEMLDRLIFIDPLGMGPLDFDINDDQKQKLVQSGKEAVMQYFSMPK